jgi:nucleoside-diphosphate-sugar epimerase
MNILVTGSAGRIGSSVSHVLLNRGDQVVGFDPRPFSIEHSNLVEFENNFSDKEALERASEGVEAMLHKVPT